jgi:uncharacterized protein YkwD
MEEMWLMIKKLLFFLLIPSFCLAGDMAILKENSNIVLPNIEYREQALDWRAELEYNQEGYWTLKSLEETTDERFKKDEIIAAVNEARINGAPCSIGNLPKLEWNKNLAKAALSHSLDMAENNNFSHTGTDGSQFTDRIRETDFRGRPIGENIGAGYKTVEAAVEGWKNSLGHCRNLMNPSATCFGYAMVKDPSSKWTYYHTLVLGRK